MSPEGGITAAAYMVGASHRPNIMRRNHELFTIARSKQRNMAFAHFNNTSEHNGSKASPYTMSQASVYPKEEYHPSWRQNEEQSLTYILPPYIMYLNTI